MEGKKFAIVKFTSEEDEVGVICTSWIINENRNFCYYPNAANEVTEKLLKKQAVPTVEWKTYSIKVLKEYETYSDARMSLRKAEETSNLDSDPEELTKRKRRPRAFSSDEEYDVAAKPCKASKISTYPSLDSFNSKVPPLTTDVSNFCTAIKSNLHRQLFPPENNTRHSSNIPSSLISPSAATSSSTPSRILEPDNYRLAVVLGQLQSTVADLVQEVKEMHHKLDALATVSNSGSQEQESFSSEMMLLGKLPLNTLEDFDENEENLKEIKYHNLLVKVLLSLGGRECRTYTYNILRRLMTCQLATNFSFTGKQPKDKEKEKKRAFCSTRLYRSVQAVLRKVYPETKDDTLKFHISLWLQQAKHRLNRRGITKENSPTGPE